MSFPFLVASGEWRLGPSGAEASATWAERSRSEIPHLPKKSFTNIFMALTKGDIPLSSGEGNHTAGGNSVVSKIPDSPNKNPSQIFSWH